MRTENTLPRLPLVLAALALVVSIATALALWLEWPSGAAAEPSSSTSDRDVTAPPSPPKGLQSVDDDQVLETLTTAFAEYLAASEAITSEGAVSSSQIADYVTAEYLPTAWESHTRLLEGGYRTEGASTFDSVSLVELDRNGDGSATARINLCLDSSDFIYVATSGPSTEIVVPSVPRRDIDVDFELSADESERPLISSATPSPSDGAC